MQEGDYHIDKIGTIGNEKELSVIAGNVFLK